MADNGRLAHIWITTPTYLVAVHVEGAGRQLDPYTSPLMDDFAVVIS